MRTRTLIKRAIAAGILAAITMRVVGAECADGSAPRWVRGRADGLSVGDVVQFDSGSARWNRVAVGDLPSLVERKSPVYLVCDIRNTAFQVNRVTESGSPKETAEDGAVLLAEGKRVTLVRDKKAFLESLNGAAGEIDVEQKRNPFSVGDIAALNATSGYLVRVASGRVQQELRQGTRLYLVTDVPRRNHFRISRVTGGPGPEGDVVATNP